jgi:hypothetical protein
MVYVIYLFESIRTFLSVYTNVSTENLGKVEFTGKNKRKF